MGSGEQPEFSLVAEEVIVSHCLWSLVSQKEIEILLDVPGELVAIRLTGRAIANSKAAEITIQVLKEDVIRICEHPARNTNQRDIARFVYDGIMSRVFCEPPIVLLSPASEPTEPAVKPD
jgi:hypothetical protein